MDQQDDHQHDDHHYDAKTDERSDGRADGARPTSTDPGAGPGTGTATGLAATVPVLVLISGAPGSGKSTLAHTLARTIGHPALIRDELKQGLTLGRSDYHPADDDDATRRVFDLYGSTLALWLRSGVSVVAEAAFQTPRWQLVLDRLDCPYDLRLVRCRVADAIARERMAARLRDPRRRAHADQATLDRALTFEQVDLGVPTLDVDTGGGYRPALAEVATFATAGLSSRTGSGRD